VSRVLAVAVTVTNSGSDADVRVCPELGGIQAAVRLAAMVSAARSERAEAEKSAARTRA